jgi:hypothetical protein
VLPTAPHKDLNKDLVAGLAGFGDYLLFILNFNEIVR